MHLNKRRRRGSLNFFEKLLFFFGFFAEVSSSLLSTSVNVINYSNDLFHIHLVLAILPKEKTDFFI